MKSFGFFPLMVVTAGFLLAAVSARSETNPMSDGDTWYLAGQYELAAKYYSEASLRDPFDAEAFYRWGLCLFRKDRLEEARSCFARALGLRPSHTNARIMLERSGGRPSERKPSPHLAEGVARFREGRYGSAAFYFTLALMEDPKLTAPHFNLAVTYYKLGRFEESEREIRQCLSINPRHMGARYLAVVIEQARGDSKKARARLREWAAWNPGDSFVQDAQRRLALAESANARATWHGSVQTFTGLNHGWGGSAATPVTLRGLSQEFYFQGGWNPWGGRIPVQFFGGLGLATRGTNEGPINEFFNSLGASWNTRVRPGMVFSAGGGLQQAFRSGTRNYWHEQGTLSLQISRRWVEMMQVQVQGMVERYPGTEAMNSTGWTASWGGWQNLKNDFNGFFSYAYRQNHAKGTMYRYHAHGATLGVRKNSPRRWGMDAYLQFQRMTYPQGTGNSADPSRTDKILDCYAAYRHPLGKALFLSVGDDWTYETSGFPVAVRKSNKASAGLLWYF